MQIINRQINNIYRKILYKNKLAPINISYTKSNRWYDYSLNLSQDPLLSFLPYNNSFPINNQLYFINEPLSFTQTLSNFVTYIPKILFFHDSELISMKKEDLYLLNKKIQPYKKYTFVPELINLIPDIKKIEYGFTSIDKELLFKRNKSILFITEESNMDQILFSHIKQMYPDADVLLSKSYRPDIESILVNYKICIHLASGYNTLLAASRGCITISSKQEKDIPHHYVATDISKILECIHYINNNLDSQANINNHDAITNKYPYSTFFSYIQNIIKEQVDTEGFYE